MRLHSSLLLLISRFYFQCSRLFSSFQIELVLAGDKGFEPSYDGVKVRCLNHLTTPLRGETDLYNQIAQLDEGYNSKQFTPLLLIYLLFCTLGGGSCGNQTAEVLRRIRGRHRILPLIPLDAQGEATYFRLGKQFLRLTLYARCTEERYKHAVQAREIRSILPAGQFNFQCSLLCRPSMFKRLIFL